MTQLGMLIIRTFHLIRIAMKRSRFSKQVSTRNNRFFANQKQHLSDVFALFDSPCTLVTYTVFFFFVCLSVPIYYCIIFKTHRIYYALVDGKKTHNCTSRKYWSRERETGYLFLYFSFPIIASVNVEQIFSFVIPRLFNLQTTTIKKRSRDTT